MSDDDELRFHRHVLNQLSEPPDVGVVERRVHFVQDTERAGLILENAYQQGQRGQRLFSAGEQQNVLQFLARGRSYHVNSAFRRVQFVGQAHKGLATAEQLAERELEILVDLLKRFLELLPRELVNLLDGGFGVRDRLQKVLALGLQEFVPLRGFLIFLKG